MKAIYFKNKKDNGVMCSCCGRKIIKGYTVGIRNVGEDCFDNIQFAIDRDIKKPSTIFGIQKMHIDWINA
jgi:hypothetical protein